MSDPAHPTHRVSVLRDANTPSGAADDQAFGRSAERRPRLQSTLARMAAHVIRRRNQVVREADLTIPRGPTPWALDEWPIEIGPENIDTLMTPELLVFLGGDSVRRSLDGIRGGNRLIVVSDHEGYAAYGHIVVNSEEYLRVLGEREPVPYLGNFFTAPRARRRGLFEKVHNESQRVLQRLGYRRVVGEARPTNVGSIKGGERMGMRVIRHFTGWVICEALVIQRDILNGGPWQVVRR